MSNKTRTLLIIVGSLLAAGVILALFILEEESYNTLWEDVAEGTVGQEDTPIETQEFEIFLTASEKERSLRISPHPESGWGYPNFSIGVQLEDPNGNVVAALPRDYVFSAPEDRESEYQTSLKFTVPEDGVYTLYVIPRTTHIDSIRLEIREKK